MSGYGQRLSRPDLHISKGHRQDLPVPALGVSTHARVYDSAESKCNSQITLHSMLPSRSENTVGTRKKEISELNGWPVLSSVNASAMTLLSPPHDSRSVWFARPSPYDSYIRYPKPILTGAFSLTPTPACNHSLFTQKKPYFRR